MGTLRINQFWTDHLQARWFKDKHKEFIEKLSFYDECLRPSVHTIDGERLYNMLLSIINRGANKTFMDDVEHLCNRFTGWGQKDHKLSNPQDYYKRLSSAYRIAIMEFMPNIKTYADSNPRIYKAVTQ